MNELFKVLLGGRGLSEDKIKTMTAEFSGMVLLTIVGATENKFTEEDKQTLKTFGPDDINDMFNFLRSKYESDADWKEMVEKEVLPLLDNYVNSVVPK